MAPMEMQNPESGITFFRLKDGSLYLHTHKGESSREIADSLIPYIGRKMTAYLPNDYGHHNTYGVTLIAVDGESVTVEEMRSGLIRTYSAFDVFGSDGHPTVIDPEPNS